MDWNGIESVETDDGQKLTVADNNILKGSEHHIAPHTENEGVIGAVGIQRKSGRSSPIKNHVFTS